MPRLRAAIEIRPPSSTRIASLKPSPSLPMRFSAGIAQSSNNNSAVSLARRPSLFSFLPDRNPGVPFSTTKPEMPPRVPFSRSVTARTSEQSAYVAFVMNVLPPFRTHWSPRRTAVVRIPPASEPEPGSVNPHAPSHCPLASLGMYFFRCSSLPASMMWFVHSELCEATIMPTLPSTRESSSIAVTYST